MTPLMKLLLERKWKKPTYTIGRLYIDDTFFCNTLEDTDSGLKQTDPLNVLKSKKISGETAIPTGIYKVDMNTVSPKYSAIKWYKDICNGKLPRLSQVPGYEGILIHPGNTANDSLGCILVGENKVKGGLVNSKETFKKLHNILKGNDIIIEIK